MRIITISRQFGSGGRELGRELAKRLDWDYYDREIIEELCAQSGLDENYVGKVLSTHERNDAVISPRNTFSVLTTEPDVKTELLTKQRQILESIAGEGRDCIIVGRDADIILEKYAPLRLFVCADMDRRIERCMKYEETIPDSECLSEKQVVRNIRRIDKRRSLTREIFTGKEWEDSTNFDLTVNTGGRDIKALAEAVAGFAKIWFEDNGEN